MRALTRISIALLLGIFIIGGAWAQAADQNSASNTAAPGPNNQGMMGRHNGQSGYERISQQLNLTDQQKTQMRSLMQGQRQQAQAIRQDTSLTAEQKKDKLQQLRQSNHQQMMSLLTPDQQQKLQQLRSERKGMGGGGMGPGARLNLTPDQKSKLDPIFQSSRQQVQAVRNDASLTPEQKQAKISEIRQNTQSQINGILTPEQQQQWQRMQQMHKGRHGGKPGPPPAPPSGF